MEENIPRSAPLQNKESLLKPLEVSSNDSSNLNINNEKNNNKNNNNQNEFGNDLDFMKNIEKNYSNKIIQKANGNSRPNLKINIQNINSGINVNIIEGVIPKKKKNKYGEIEPQKLPRTSPYNFKYFCNTANKRSINQAITNKTNTKTETKSLESNFIKLSKDANIYTANASYITNKKMLLFDKYDFENNKYRPNRAKLFDMTSIPKSKDISNTLYKTTKFRGGKMYFFEHNKRPKILDMIKENDINEQYANKKPLYLKDIQKSENKIIEKETQKEKQKKFVDYSYQKHKRHPPSNTLYKELMNKKNEIYDNFLERFGQENYETNIQSLITLPNASYEEEKIKKNKNDNLNGFQGLLSKKRQNGIPLTYPFISSNMVKCETMSEKSRYINIMETFVKLKSMIDNDKNSGLSNERQYILDFISNKNIDKKDLTEKNLNNFSNFLKCKKMPIDKNKSLKENILIALNYNNEDFNNEYNIILENKENEKNNFKEEKLSNNKKPTVKRSRIYISETNIFNNKQPLEYDIPRQKKLLSEAHYKSDYDLTYSLQKELKIIEDDFENMQNKIKKVEDNLNLLPFASDYYYKYNLNKMKYRKEKPKDLRLISQREFNKSYLEQLKTQKKVVNKCNIYDFNERLYYTWYKNNNIGDIKNYKKQTKLTEYIIYNRTKEKLINEEIKKIAEKKDLKMNKGKMNL